MIFYLSPKTFLINLRYSGTVTVSVLYVPISSHLTIGILSVSNTFNESLNSLSESYCHTTGRPNLLRTGRNLVLTSELQIESDGTHLTYVK